MGRRRYDSNRNGNRQQKPIANPKRVNTGTVLKSEMVAPRDWDADGPDPHPAYTQAVSAVLGALEGLWYDSEFSHLDYADKTAWETAVNDEISIIKGKIQEML